MLLLLLGWLQLWQPLIPVYIQQQGTNIAGTAREHHLAVQFDRNICMLCHIRAYTCEDKVAHVSATQ